MFLPPPSGERKKRQSERRGEERKVRLALVHFIDKLFSFEAARSERQGGSVSGAVAAW